MSEKSTPQQIHRRIRHIVALGNTPVDGHIRVTKGEQFDVLMGSDETHNEMAALCMRIDERLRGESLKLEDLTEQEFIHLLMECGETRGGLT